MKVFVSWSGELSKEIAEVLKKWIPCIIQSVEVFYSPEDIEKSRQVCESTGAKFRVRSFAAGR